MVPQRLLLLGAAALAASTLETADLVDLCGQTWQGAGLRLLSHSASRRFYFVAPDTDCGLWMRAAAAGDRTRFQFCFFLVYSLAAAARAPPGSRAPNASSPAPADPCAPGSYLQFYEGPPGAPRPPGALLCGLTIPAPVASSRPFLGLRLLTRGRQPRVDFVGEATSFRLGASGAYFRCQNGRCIPPSLVCDRWGVDNCGDGSDQASGPPADCRVKYHRQVWGNFKEPKSSPGKFCVFLYYFPLQIPLWCPARRGVTDGPKSKPLTLPPALRSAGTLQTAAQSTPLAGRAPEQQGPRLRGVALVSSLVLVSAGLLVGLLWGYCSSRWLAWRAGAHGLCPGCTACYPCPGRVAPGGLQASGPALQGRGGQP
ncbi:low-density lipoprotein receptor class A domain-containing protein 2 [Leptonychotes weddellii]|uniref:Low-density lipoprotein receptor class A domain-containing protein 2 n=1 Tax=Leptonychotes weddellii TaxID=9713 RepID=A0A7F8RSB4_LEPWE|nr:low-density lipoprotein receptor class A domain-containing protein 2 [Leptonychotes weddellii]